MSLKPLIEVWAEIPDYPDYAVSNLGNVINLRHNRLLALRTNSYGHKRVALYKNSERVDVYVHHLVAKMFITGYIPGGNIKHFEDVGDNNVFNLHFSNGRRLGQLVRYPPKPRVRKIRILETGQIFATVDECAAYLNSHVSSIRKVLRGEREHHKGYTFERCEVEL